MQFFYYYFYYHSLLFFYFALSATDNEPESDLRNSTVRRIIEVLLYVAKHILLLLHLTLRQPLAVFCAFSEKSGIFLSPQLFTSRG